MNKLLIIIKPGFLEFAETILEAFANIGFAYCDYKQTVLTQEQCDIIWKDLKAQAERHPKKPQYAQYYADYCNYIMSGEVRCIIMESESDNYDRVLRTKLELRHNNGFAKSFRDMLHTSDTNADALAEIDCIFNNN